MNRIIKFETSFDAGKNTTAMKTINDKCNLICYVVVLFLLVSGRVNSIKGQDNQTITIEVEKNQTIRSISQKYLQNPDLWPDILRANGLSFPHEVKPGMTLHIPVEAISRANQELENSQLMIRKAAEAGAKIFAPEVISNAVDLRNSAIERRKAGDWSDCSRLARSAGDEAKKALEISETNQDMPAEAVVQHLYGQVHRRKPSDNIWKDVSQYDILLEDERIRTLSQSYVDILFRDDSRLQLKENAQALIGKMRSNLLKKTEEANVKLIKGDVLALLTGSKRDNKFQLDVPEVDTKINSKRFWISRDDKAARFVNYDGELEISSAGAKVVLGENQGSIVQHKQKPSVPRKILSPPELLKPENGDRLFKDKAALSWTEVEGAKEYRLEFARNGSFSKIVWSDVISDTEGVFPRELGYGLFYWRVTAISSDELPGRYSKARFFGIMESDALPFLVVRTPSEEAVLSDTTVLVSGNTEKDIILTVQGQTVEVAADGEFEFYYKPVKGENKIAVEATNRTGKVSKVERTITFYPDTGIELSFDPSLQQIGRNHFLVRDRGLSLSGKTVPHGFIIVTSLEDSLSPSLTATTEADSEGQFHISMQLKESKEKLSIEVVSPIGKVRQDRFTVEIDNEPPIISFTGQIPSVTGQGTISVTGVVEKGIDLYLNEQSIPLYDGNFNKEIELNPGMNRLSFKARDEAGNVTPVEKEVFFDPDAPVFVEYELSLQEAQGGEEASVTVQANDATGLVKAAPFTIQIGEYTHTGYMIFSREKERYIGSFRVPDGVKGKINLRNVTLSDYLGNSKKYSF